VLIKIALSIYLHACNSWKKAEQILMKLKSGEFYENLMSHFAFHVDQTSLTATSHKDIFLM
jgi:hypothetical protein